MVGPKLQSAHVMDVFCCCCFVSLGRRLYSVLDTEPTEVDTGCSAIYTQMLIGIFQKYVERDTIFKREQAMISQLIVFLLFF